MGAISRGAGTPRPHLRSVMRDAMVMLAVGGGGDPLLGELVVVLVMAGLVSLLFQKLKLSAIPAYLVAGAIIGPGLLGVVATDEHVASISQLAIVMLMFGIGLHMDAGALRGGFATIVGVGVVSCLVVTGLVAAGAVAFGQPAPAAVLIGAGISMSSTAAVMRLLQQRRELRDLHGRVAFGALIVQDLYAVVALAAVPMLVAWAGVRGDLPVGADDAAGVGVMRVLLPRMLLAVGGIAAIVVLGRRLLPVVLLSAARGSHGELVLIVGAAAALGSAAATSALGLSAELGAFLAGFLLASTPARHQLMGQLAPVRDLFIPVFFVAVGLGVDLNAAFSMWWIVLVVLVLVVAIKTVVVALTAWGFGFSGPVAVMAGLVLAQTGEFTLLTISVGSTRGLIGTEAMAVVTTVVALSLILTPTLIAIAPRAASVFVGVPLPVWKRRRLGGVGFEGASPERTKLRAVIAGFGPVGRELYTRLDRAGFDCTIIELNPDTVRRQRGLGRRVIYGDAANPGVLEEAGVETADAVLLTMPDHNAMLAACRLVRASAPEAFVAVRSGFLSRGMQATALGADYVAIDEIAAASVMADEVCSKLGERSGANEASRGVSPGAS